MDQQIDRLSRFGLAITLYGREVLTALVILVGGLILSKIIVKQVRKLLERLITKPPLVATVSTSVYFVLVILVVIAALRYAGLETIVIRRLLMGAILGAVGLIVLFRPYIPALPYRAGNMVQAAGLLGIVEGTTILYTRLRTFDGRTVFIPNSKILNDTVINYHYIPNRQFRITVLVDYKDDLLKAKGVIAELLAEDPRILDNPPARSFVLNLADNGVELGVWGWVKNADYWRTRGDLLEKIKLRFDQEGITIPFPQRQVHMIR